MSEQFEQHPAEPQENAAFSSQSYPAEQPEPAPAETNSGLLGKLQAKFTNQQLIIGGAVIAAVIILVLFLLIPSKFERVKNEALQIAGRISGSGDYFIIDTYPDEYKNMDPLVAGMLAGDAQENALEAIQYVNEELGFSSSVYSDMLSTNALMGRQSEENAKYKVSWTYHPDDGLEVKYEKK